MPLFDIPNRPGRQVDSGVLQKAKSKVKLSTALKSGGGLTGRIAQINAVVSKNLSKYEEESLIINTPEQLHQYIDKCIANGVISIDTETTGLDPILDEIAGVCIYTPGEKTAYIPINHVSYITLERLPEQLTSEQVAVELERINEHNVKVIMFNAAFDIRVLRNQCNVYLTCYWDCYLGARCLNENEGAGNNGLKKLHQKYVLNGEGDAFKFDDLFKGIPFTYVPIKTGYLYAAHDAIITYELYKFQEEYLGDNAEQYGLKDVAWVFRNIEMEIVDVVCNMEDNGVEFDTNFANELSVKYHAQLETKLKDINAELDKYKDKIEMYKMEHANHKLDDPINIGSTSQLATLFYDILKVPNPDPKNPNNRGTGEEYLAKMDLPIAKLILDYREVTKLLTTYIDKLPNVVNPKDGRIHCKFNQYGADTGRFSSNDPRPRINWGHKIRLIHGRALA